MLPDCKGQWYLAGTISKCWTDGSPLLPLPIQHFESKLWAPLPVPRAIPARGGCFRCTGLWSCCFIPASTGDMPCMDQGEQVLSSWVLFLAVTATLLSSAPHLEVLRVVKCSYRPAEMIGAISPDFLCSTGDRRALAAPRAQPIHLLERQSSNRLETPQLLWGLSKWCVGLT